MPQPLDLSRRERQIMDALFAAGSATVAEVRDRLEQPPSANAVRTFLTILEQKGHVKRRKAGRSYHWSPAHRHDHTGRDDLKRVVQTFFGGSPARAFAAYLADRDTELSDDELERLRETIEEARSKGN